MINRWEYIVINAEQNPQVTLADLGQQGWELVHVKESIIGGTVSFILWLKRVIE